MKELVLLIINNCVYWNTCVLLDLLVCSAPLRPSRGHIAFVLFQTYGSFRFGRKLKRRCFKNNYLCKAAPLQARKKNYYLKAGLKQTH